MTVRLQANMEGCWVSGEVNAVYAPADGLIRDAACCTCSSHLREQRQHVRSEELYLIGASAISASVRKAATPRDAKDARQIARCSIAILTLRSRAGLPRKILPFALIGGNKASVQMSVTAVSAIAPVKTITVSIRSSRLRGRK